MAESAGSRPTHSVVKRVLQTSRYPAGDVGGIEQVVAALQQELNSNQDLEFRCIAAFPRRTRLTRVPLIGDLVAAVTLAVRAGRLADVVIVHGAEYAWPFLLPFCRGKRKVVVVWHGIRSQEALPPARSPMLRLLMSLFRTASRAMQMTATRADLLVAVGPAVAASLEAHLPPNQTVRIVPNGVYTHSQERGVGAAKDASGKASAAQTRIVWSGSSPYQKGLDVALEACAIARDQDLDLLLTVLGCDREQAPSAFRKAKWVQWLGRVEPSRVPGILADVDVFLCTSRSEACSMAVLEALAAGLVVVGSPTVAWMIESAGIALPSLEPDVVASAIVIAADAASRGSIGAEAIRRAGEFSWSGAARCYEDAIRELLTP